MQIRNFLYVDIQVSKSVQTPAHFTVFLIYLESWKAFTVAKCNFELRLPCANTWASANPRRYWRSVAHTFLLLLFLCKAIVLYYRLTLISSTAYLFVLCWLPLHFDCSLFSCSWSNHITEFYFFFFSSSRFLFFFFKFASHSHAHMARSSLTSFDISLLPHFNINCLPEEKQVWG